MCQQLATGVSVGCSVAVDNLLRRANEDQTLASINSAKMSQGDRRFIAAVTKS
jgi:hypothetical protein